ncbi:MAG TPA: hypothetical protein VF579_07095 [Candidatus Methylomirabilis sp.]
MRPHTSILIPVKATGRAKGRLAELLDQPARQELDLTMLEDVLAAVMPAAGHLVAPASVRPTSDPRHWLYGYTTAFAEFPLAG